MGSATITDTASDATNADPVTDERQKPPAAKTKTPTRRKAAKTKTPTRRKAARKPSPKAPAAPAPSAPDVAELLAALQAQIAGSIGDLSRGVGDIAGDLATLRGRIEHLERGPVHPPPAPPALEVFPGRGAVPQQAAPPHARLADEHRQAGVPRGARTGAEATGHTGTAYRTADGMNPPPGAVVQQHSRPLDVAVTSTHGGVTHRVADELATDPVARAQVAPPPGAAAAAGQPRRADNVPDLRGSRLEQKTGELSALVLELRGLIDGMHPEDKRKPGALARWSTLSSSTQTLVGHLADD